VGLTKTHAISSYGTLGKPRKGHQRHLQCGPCVFRANYHFFTVKCQKTPQIQIRKVGPLEKDLSPHPTTVLHPPTIVRQRWLGQPA
jgi:hypothetical protein